MSARPLVVASDRPLPADVDQLKTMILPGATGGPGGGVSPTAVLSMPRLSTTRRVPSGFCLHSQRAAPAPAAAVAAVPRQLGGQDHVPHTR